MNVVGTLWQIRVHADLLSASTYSTLNTLYRSESAMT